jgi:uncharacterized repeat protein (TIGR01451 family)
MKWNRTFVLLLLTLLLSANVASAQAITWASKVAFRDGQPANSKGGNSTDPSLDALGNIHVSRISTAPADAGGGVIAINTGSDPFTNVRDKSNRIAGTVYYDLNKNGVQDPGESGFLGAIVAINPGPSYCFSGTNGNYMGGTAVGKYNLSIPNPPRYHTVTTPTKHSAKFATLGKVDSLNHFGLYPTPNINDMRIQLTAYHASRPGDIVDFHLHYFNAGTTTLNATVKFLPDALLSVLQSSPGANKLLLDTLSWKVSNLAPQAQGSIIISCMAPTIPTIALGDTLLVEAWIDPASGDADPEDNYDLLTEVVVGDYDHNDLQVQPAGDIAIANVASGTWLDYTIRFQNTGTDTVLQVIVRDSLDSNLDISTLEMLESSHGYRLDLSGPGILAWHFNAIQLPDSNINKHASHGFIRFRIRPKTTLQEGQAIKNRVGIYFDSNQPVLTNTVTNTVVKSTLVAYLQDQSMVARVYPNPSSEQIFIEADVSSAGMLTAYVICDHQGRSIKTFTFRQYAGKQVHIADISDLAAGIYFLYLEQNGHTVELKLVVE